MSRERTHAGLPIVNGHDQAPILQSIELGQFLDLKLVQAALVLGKLIREGTLLMVYGPAGAGKTYLMLAMAVAVAYGIEILGWRPPEPAPVVYVDGEMVATELQQRLKDLMLPILKTLDHPWQPLHIVTPDLQPHGIKPIDTAEGKAALIDLVKEKGARIVVLDNLSCLTNPEDDNAAGSWQAVQELLLALRRCKIAVILGHHSGKNGQQRGTSRRADILDVILKLTPVTDQDDARTRVTIEFEKGRALESADKQTFIACLEPHPDGGLMWSRSDSPALIQDRIRQMLLDGMPATTVASELGAATSYVYRVRKQMMEAGELENSSSKGRTLPLSTSKRVEKGNRDVRAGEKTRGKRGESRGIE